MGRADAQGVRWVARTGHDEGRDKRGQVPKGRAGYTTNSFSRSTTDMGRRHGHLGSFPHLHALHVPSPYRVPAIQRQTGGIDGQFSSNQTQFHVALHSLTRRSKTCVGNTCRSSTPCITWPDQTRNEARPARRAHPEVAVTLITSMVETSSTLICFLT